MFGIGIIEIAILATVGLVMITVPIVIVLASTNKSKQREHDTE